MVNKNLTERIGKTPISPETQKVLDYLASVPEGHKKTTAEIREKINFDGFLQTTLKFLAEEGIIARTPEGQTSLYCLSAKKKDRTE
jgi:hypothetical protein